jgi:Flp pilus assembly CpaF family ATPase
MIIMADKRRLIFLKMEYLDLKGKKVKKEEEQKLREELCQQSIKQFKKELKTLLDDKSIKLVKDYSPEPQILIEFDEKKLEPVLEALRSADIVEVIDAMLPQA